jgi:anti-sigma B factor antagonist
MGARVEMSSATGARAAESGEAPQVVVVSGRVDGSTSDEVRARLHGALSTALDAGRQRVVVDLSGAATLDATGLGVLFGAHWRAARQGQQVVLRGMPPRIAAVLRATRLHRLLRHEPTAA